MWKEWLNYSRSQRYGTVVLMFLVILVAFYPLLYQTLYLTPEPIVEANVFYRVDSFFTALKYSPPQVNNQFSFTEEERPLSSKPELFAFDPNTVSTAELVRLGLSARQAAVIDNFRSKGGFFREPKDFAKMYVIDSATFRTLEPFIRIAPRDLIVDSARLVSAPKVREKVYLNLNTVDTLQITRVKGIGRGFARRIVDYRQRLGGFYSVNQLLDIYGFSPELLEQVKQELWVDTLSVQTKNINMADYYELRNHPYLTDYQARAIIYYRETMGNFIRLEDMVKHKLVDTTTFRKVKPYLTVQ
jgi:DNA uptake protein ComE-like DNA-binding protein